MFKILTLTALTTVAILSAKAQTNPAITSWLQNNSIIGRHYVSGNSTAIQDADLANVQKVEYSTNWVYITTQGVPSYITGPFLDGNPSFTTAQNAIFKLALNPTQNTGTASVTTGGNIGQFVNGVALFDYRDGVAWNATSSALCGGPGNPPCPGGPNANMDWNRDAVLAEKAGFDCSKGHPAMGNYHHHQNPSAFKLDKNVVSTICNLYDADGLYVIDSTQHSPLIGFAADGFPIYGAYAYKNLDGTGGITRMKSGYQLKNQTTRTNGPAVGQVLGTQTFFNGYFREDYEFVAHPSDPSYLDVHNGRICKTPEYPNGIYCYFATVDNNWNSAYPYVVGPTFYGVKNGTKVTSVTEPTTVYTTPTAINNILPENVNVTIFPNPSNEFIAVQITKGLQTNLNLELYDITGKLINKATIYQGSTIAYFDTRTLYNGEYFIKMGEGKNTKTQKLIINKN